MRNTFFVTELTQHASYNFIYVLWAGVGSSQTIYFIMCVFRSQAITVPKNKKIVMCIGDDARVYTYSAVVAVAKKKKQSSETATAVEAAAATTRHAFGILISKHTATHTHTQRDFENTTASLRLRHSSNGFGEVISRLFSFYIKNQI